MKPPGSQFSADGFTIAPFGKGRNAIQSDAANDLVRALNALGRIELSEIVTGTPKVHYSDGRIVIEMLPAGSGGGGGSGVTVTEHDSDPTIADVISLQFPNGSVTDIGGGVAKISVGALTVKEEDGTPDVANVTEIKFTNGTVTNNGSGSVSVAVGSGGSCRMATISSISAEYLTVSDGVNSFNVAKWPENRTTFTGETIDGTAFGYAYSTNNQRTATAGADVQTEVLYRRYVVGQVVYAVMSENGTGVSGVDWVEQSPRVWLRKWYP